MAKRRQRSQRAVTFCISVCRLGGMFASTDMIPPPGRPESMALARSRFLRRTESPWRPRPRCKGSISMIPRAITIFCPAAMNTSVGFQTTGRRWLSLALTSICGFGTSQPIPYRKSMRPRPVSRAIARPGGQSSRLTRAMPRSPVRPAILSPMTPMVIEISFLKI